jgi:hypothetical protein
MQYKSEKFQAHALPKFYQPKHPYSLETIVVCIK